MIIAKYLLALTGSLAIFLSLSAKVEAQAALTCPADWASDTRVLSDDVLAPTADGWHDFKEFEYNFTYNKGEFPLYGSETLEPTDLGLKRNLSPATVDFNTNIPASVFTKVYANFSNVLYPFVNASDAEVSQFLQGNTASVDPNSDYARWIKNYCIDGVLDKGSSQEAVMTLTTKASMSAWANVYVCQEQDWFSAANPTADNVCKDIEFVPNVGCPGSPLADNPNESGNNPEPVCVEQKTVFEATRNLEGFKSEEQRFAMPYRLALRDIARKTAFTIKEQFCKVGEQNACLHEDYTCVKEGDPIPGRENERVLISRNDPTTKGKDGVCYLTPESMSLSLAQQVAQRLCATTVKEQAVKSLDSLMCHYGSLNYRAFTPVTIRVNPSISKANTSDTVASAGVSKNSLPFDQDLFVDNGEELNLACAPGNVSDSCQIDGYYRRALQNKLSMYTEQDRGIFDQLNYRVQIVSDNETPYEVSGRISQGGGSMNYGFDRKFPDAWSFDYIDKLGGYVMLSEEARIFNPDLLPAGDRVVMDGNNEVYMRGGQVFFNNYVVSNRPRLNIDGSSVAESPAAYDDFIRVNEAIDAMMSQVQKRITNPYGEELFELSQMYACFAFQNENGYATDPDGVNSQIPEVYVPGTDQVICQLYAERYGLRFRRDDVPSVNGLRPIGIDPIRDPEVAEVLDLFWDYYKVVLGITINCSTSADFTACIAANKDILDQAFEDFRVAYQQLRDRYGVQFSNFNPTIHCVNRACVTTFISGESIYAGISRDGQDIPSIWKVPIEGGTFPQISHRAFITKEGNVVVVYSQLDSTYKIVLFQPGVPSSVKVVDTGMNYLGQLDALYYEDASRAENLVIASYVSNQQNPASAADYDVYGIANIIGGVNTPLAEGRLNFGGILFAGFRPGPNISLAVRGGELHAVAPVGESNGAGLLNEGFENRLEYVRAVIGANSTAPEIITDNPRDRQFSRIPNGPTIFASRILSNSGRSLMIDLQGNPIVVWINRVENRPPDDVARTTTWETYTQAFMARKTGLGWSVLPLSDRAVGVVSAYEGLVSEVRNVFISSGAIGMTVNDAITKRSMQTRMMDAAGAKRCVYTTGSIVRTGSTHCASLTDIQYVKPNKGEWIFETAVRP